MTEYKLFEESKYNRLCGFYITYGIIVFEDGLHTRTISDISVNKEKVEQLISAFNELELSPRHLNEAVEDFLYDFS